MPNISEQKNLIKSKLLQMIAIIEDADSIENVNIGISPEYHEVVGGKFGERLVATGYVNLVFEAKII